MENRDKIINCALELFAQRGYDAVGVQEIVNKAGITKPTMYYYFKSKQGLLETILQEKGKALIEKLEVAAHSEGTIGEVLFEVARAYFRFAEEEFTFSYFMLGLNYSPKESEGHQAVSPLLKRLYKLVCKVFEEKADVLGNMNGRQEQFTSGFLGAINCYMMVCYEKGENIHRLSEDTKVRSVVNQFLYGIFS